MFAQAKLKTHEIQDDIAEGAARVVDIAKTVNQGVSNASATARDEVLAHPLRFLLVAVAAGVASALYLRRSVK